MADVGLKLNGLAEAPVAQRGPRHTVVAYQGGIAALIQLGEAAAIQDEWAGLAKDAAEQNVFFHPDLALPAMDNLGGNVVAATVRDARGKLIGLAPVTQGRLGRVAPAVRLWSHDYAPLGVPLVDRTEIEEAVTGLIEGIATSERSLIVPDLRLAGPVAAAMLIAAERLRRPVEIVDAHRRAALFRSGEAAEDIRAALPTRRRKEFSRQLRRLADLGPVRFETATGLGPVQAQFEEFLALEAAGWKGEKGTALSSSASTSGFAREIVRNQARNGAARIISLRLGDQAIAMVVCFIAGNTAYTWKIAYDESFARFSPGAQLMLEAPKSLFSDGKVCRIDSCAAADHPMIDHLWKDRLEIGTLVIGPSGGGPLYRLGMASLNGETAARAAARRLLTRIKARKKNRETEA